MRKPFPALLVLAACHQAPASVEVVETSASTNSVDVIIAFKDARGNPYFPEGGDVTVVVEDLDARDRKVTSKRVMRVADTLRDPEDGPTKYVHVKRSWPPLWPYLTRRVVVKYGALTAEKIVQTAARPALGGEAAADPNVTLKPTIAAFPMLDSVTMDQSYGGDERIARISSDDRDRLLADAFYSWDDVAAVLGVPGARPVCPSTMNRFAQDLPRLGRLVMIYRFETCVEPKAAAATKTLALGQTRGHVGIVDVSDGTVLCYGRISAATAAPNDELARTFSASLHGAAIARARELSPLLVGNANAPRPSL